MPTGACGINCDVCKLHVIGVCSTCGSGVSREGDLKAEIQVQILGQPCPILACARMNRHPYCIRDCSSFPCENFRSGPYPFSPGYLNMQERRRKEYMNPLPQGNTITTPPEFWHELKQRNLEELCRLSLTTPAPPEGLILNFLHMPLLVDIQHQQIKCLKNNRWEPYEDSLLELIIVVYLLNVKPDILSNEMIGVKDLKDAQFFQGPHELRTTHLIERFGNDIHGFKRAAEYLNGISLNLADAAYKLMPLPKIPIYYLLWKGDQEFPPVLSILFDRSIEKHLAADAIWGLVNLVSNMLLFTY